MPVLHHLQSFLFEINGFGHNRHLSIQFAQLKVVGGQLRGYGQANIFQICRGRLIGGIRRLHISAHATEKVEFIIQIKWNLEIILRYWVKLQRRAAKQRAVARKSLALRRYTGSQPRIEVRSGNAGKGTRLRQSSNSSLKTLIVGHGASFVVVELGIIEQSPP